MKNLLPVAVAMTLLALSTSGASFAEPVAGTTLLNVTVTELREVTTGWSIKNDVLGKLVYNEKNESIGRIDDVIVAPNRAVSYAIINAHRYLNVVKHDVAIPVSALKLRGGQLVLPHATQDQLKAMPEFEYAR
jgi:sporulation protein YlmC with PRC-barrel domain